MKIAFGAALAALALASAPSLALAQAACPSIGPSPAIPDGATAKQKDMASASKAMDTWIKGVNARGDCVRKQIEGERAANPTVKEFFDLSARLKAIQDDPAIKDHQSKVVAYNTEMTTAKQTADAWAAASAAFNAKKK